MWVGRNDYIHPVRRQLALMAASFLYVPLFMEAVVLVHPFFRKQVAYMTVFNSPAT